MRLDRRRRAAPHGPARRNVGGWRWEWHGMAARCGSPMWGGLWCQWPSESLSLRRSLWCSLVRFPDGSRWSRRQSFIPSPALSGSVSLARFLSFVLSLSPALSLPWSVTASLSRSHRVLSHRCLLGMLMLGWRQGGRGGRRGGGRRERGLRGSSRRRGGQRVA